MSWFVKQKSFEAEVRIGNKGCRRNLERVAVILHHVLREARVAADVWHKHYGVIPESRSDTLRFTNSIYFSGRKHGFLCFLPLCSIFRKGICYKNDIMNLCITFDSTINHRRQCSVGSPLPDQAILRFEHSGAAYGSEGNFYRLVRFLVSWGMLLCAGPVCTGDQRPLL